MARWFDALQSALERGVPAMLVHVAEIRGSAPREAGARMLVTPQDVTGTIGGGQLEYDAIHAARRQLDHGGAGTVLEWSLGPELGQCCGGAVTLAFEPFAPADHAWVSRLAKSSSEPLDSFRLIEISSTGLISRSLVGTHDDRSAVAVWAHEPVTAMERSPARHYHADISDDRKTVRIVERINPNDQPLWLFGAGHVGRAVVRALEPLPFDLTWVDGRKGMFPDVSPPNVKIHASAMPELLVDEAPPQAFYLVMTHSHPLDEEICHAVLARGDAAYLGLIGSHTKRARFLSRLRGRGHSSAALDSLTCPVGLPQIAGKAPAVVATSIAADLLMRLSTVSVPERHRIDEEHD